MSMLHAVLLALAMQDPASAPADPLAGALARSGDNRAELERALAEVPAAQRPSLAFLVEHMPQRDLRSLKAAFLLEDVALAHRARDEAPWRSLLTDELFLDYVLPYAQIDETREAWRADLRAKCLPLVEGCKTPGEAALALNGKLFPLVKVRYSTERKKANASPSESIAQGLASCTGLSILLADACRSVGVPARLCGIASWPGRGGNHTWVEVWDGGWHFLGAAEPDPAGLDRGWFAGEAKGAVQGSAREGIWAACWRGTGKAMPLPWARGAGLNAVEVTERYAVAQGGGDEALLAQITRFFSASAEEQAKFEFDRNLDAQLATTTGDAKLRALCWQAFCTLPHAELRADFKALRVRAAGKESPYVVRPVGEKPKDGWALVIAMHGGGNAAKSVNDQQWEQMQRYYKDHPEAGGYLYCALRAPTDEWNGFYTDYVYPLIERLILQFLVCSAVDPDKVFAIGYSHGGYGAFAIGPKLPDRFAAVHASASAPTDGETSAVGLHTLPFSFMVGGRDTAYGRADRCQAFDKIVRELRGERTDVYPVTFQFIADNGHTRLPDRDKLVDLLPKVRSALPRDVHWQLTDGVVRDHYWLEASAPGKGQRIDALLSGQRLEVKLQGRTTAIAHLDARLLDLGQPLTLLLDGKEEQVRLQPSLRALCQDLQRRGDPRLCGSAVLTIKAP